MNLVCGKILRRRDSITLTRYKSAVKATQEANVVKTTGTTMSSNADVCIAVALYPGLIVVRSTSGLRNAIGRVLSAD